MNNLKLILAETLYIGDGSKPLCDQAVVIDGQHIADVVPFSEAPQAETIIETEILAPGFIDLQLNGAGGKQFNDEPSVETLVCMAQAAQIGGTAWFFPTFITDYERNFEAAIKSTEAAQDECIGVVGLHLEGPFLSPHRPGIHPADAIRPIDDADEDLIAKAKVPILLTFAPEETTPDRMQRLSAHGVTLFAGHSEASYETIVAAQENGLRGATHLFNAMSQMQNREPGIVGAVLDRRALFAGIIADAIHVHEANLRTAFALMGPDRLFLVTDAMKLLGTNAIEFELFGRRITRENRQLSSESGVLAGAHISMIECVRSLISMTGCEPAIAIQMASQTPAKAVRLDHKIGTIAKGMHAGFTHLDKDFSVQSVSFGTGSKIS